MRSVIYVQYCVLYYCKMPYSSIFQFRLIKKKYEQLFLSGTRIKILEVSSFLSKYKYETNIVTCHIICLETILLSLQIK